MDILLLIAGFFLCASLIVYGGARLSKYGDIIAELTGMGKAWLGLILMAAVTSLPELFTGFSAVVIFDSPDIAVGDVMGSCAFNLLILAILDYFIPQRSLYSLVAKGHLLAVFFGILLITLSVISISYGGELPVIGWVSTTSLVLLGLYLIAIRVIFIHERRQARLVQLPVTIKPDPVYPDICLSLALRRYFSFAFLVITGGIALPYFADQLAEVAGLSKTFVGTLLVAATTSLPELVVSIAAIKIGSLDIAVGNLLGSNIFNILILSLDDFLYTKGPLLDVIDPIHALSGLFAVLMTCVVGITVFYGSGPKKFILGLDDAVIILLYTVLIGVLY